MPDLVWEEMERVLCDITAPGVAVIITSIAIGLDPPQKVQRPWISAHYILRTAHDERKTRKLSATVVVTAHVNVNINAVGASYIGYFVQSEEYIGHL